MHDCGVGTNGSFFSVNCWAFNSNDNNLNVLNQKAFLTILFFFFFFCKVSVIINH